LKLREVAPPEASVSGGGEINAQFEQKRVAMCFMGPWAVAGVRKNAPDIDVGVAEPPIKAQKATIIGSGLLVIPKISKNIDAAWTLIDYLTEISPQMKLVSAGYAFRIPTRKSILEEAWFKEYPEYMHFVKALEYGYVPFPVPEYRMVHDAIVQVELNRTFIGEKTAKEALETMETEGNKVLK